MDFLAHGYWRLVHDPTLESVKKRQHAGKRDFLDDGAIRENATVRYESSSESEDIEDPRWIVFHEEDK